MDTSKFLGKFVDATRDHLQRMNELLLMLEEDPERPDEVTELLREIHTLKGEARMMGFGDISDLAHAMEDVLKLQEEKGFAALADVSDALFRVFDVIEGLLAEKLGEGESGLDVDAQLASLRALAGEGGGTGSGDTAEGPPRPEKEAGPVPGSDAGPGGSDESFGGLDLGDLDLPSEDGGDRWGAPASEGGTGESLAEAFGIPAGRKEEIVRGGAEPGTPGVSVGGGTGKFLGKFRDATREHLQRMNTLLLRLEQEPDRPDDVRELLREIHTMKGESRMMGFGELSDLSHGIEDALKVLEETGFRDLPARSDLLFAAFDACESLLAARLGEPAAGVDLPSLLERLGGAAEAASADAAAPPPAGRPPIDAALAEPFLAVAEELVGAARQALEAGGEAGAVELRRALADLAADARMSTFHALETFLVGLLEELGPEGPVPPGRAAAWEGALAAVMEVAGAEAAGRDVTAELAALGVAVGGEPASRADAPAARPPKPSPREGEEGREEDARPAAAVATSRRKAAAPPRVEETIRISLARLEELANLSGDIYLSHSRGEERLRRLRRLLDEVKRQARLNAEMRDALRPRAGREALDPERKAELQESLAEATRAVERGLVELLRADRDEYLHVGHSIGGLRERVRELQMLPVSTLFDMYPRMVRDTARSLGKKVRLVVEGADVELDRRVLDEIRDPMVHLVRNAIDHGLESPEEREAAGKSARGTVNLVARAEGDRVVIEIRDDGKGIDPRVIRSVAVAKGAVDAAEAEALSDEAAMQLIFAAGFSSKEAVSDLSGRGVGLDVVRSKVDQLEGRIAIDSQVGQGTVMALELPLTLAMARVLLLRAGGLLVAVPSTMVEEVVAVPEASIRRVEAYEACEWHDRTLPLVSLAHVLEREARAPKGRARTIVVVAFQEHVVGFVVDGLEGEREVVVKPLEAFLGRVPNVAGSSILSSGEIVVVLHVPQLISSTMGVSPVRLRARVRPDEASPADVAPRRRLLVVDDSIIVRDMMKGVLEAAGFEVTVAVDGMDGLEKQLAESFDVVITDVEMPRMDGFELTRTLKQNEQHAEVPVIMVTTLDSPEAREKGLRVGASAYVVKNLLDMSSLVDTIERLAG